MRRLHRESLESGRTTMTHSIEARARIAGLDVATEPPLHCERVEHRPRQLVAAIAGTTALPRRRSRSSNSPLLDSPPRAPFTARSPMRHRARPRRHCVVGKDVLERWQNPLDASRRHHVGITKRSDRATVDTTIKNGVWFVDRISMQWSTLA